MDRMSLVHYAIGLCLVVLGIGLGLQPQRLSRIGFGTPEGAVQKEIPPLPRWIGIFVAAELFCFGAGILARDAVSHKELFAILGLFLFLVTWSVVAVAAGFSARQLPGFTPKTASKARSYRLAAFAYAAIGIAVLFLLFLFPLLRHR